MAPLTQLIIATGLAVQAAAKLIPVQVGNEGLNFSPDTITASQGDILLFTFAGGNHSVVMGDFNNACQPATTGGFFSGFMDISGTPQTFSVTVNSTDPIVFYCSQNFGSHCKNGMFGVVNPSGSSTLDSYQKAAAQVTSSAGSPPSVFGGTVGSAAASGSGTATGAASTPGSSQTTTAGTTTTSSSTGTTSSSTTSPTTASGSGASKSSPGMAPMFGAGLVGLLSAVTAALFLM